jgi:hypothetical protein
VGHVARKGEMKNEYKVWLEYLKGRGKSKKSKAVPVLF